MATRFYLDKRTNKDGESAVIISVSMFRKRMLTTLGFSIDPKKWNESRQRVKHGATIEMKPTKSSEKKNTSYNDINGWLNEIENHFTQLEINLTTSIDEQSELNLLDEFNKAFRKEKHTDKKDATLFDRLDEFVKEVGKENNWSEAVIKIFRALKNHLTAFNKDITFDDLNKDGLFDFLDYLKKIPIADGTKGMKNTTMRKHLSFLKWFLRWTIKKGYNTNTDFLEFNPKLRVAQKQIVFLEWSELLHVFNFEFTGKDKERLEKIRDVFCFLCFTGLRYSDVAKLKRTDINDNAITITTQKTTDTLTIELNDFSKAILNKYADENYPHNKALPVISNQKMNQQLKEVAKECGLNTLITQIHLKGAKRVETVQPKHELITTHTGRRTFISNALMKGIPVNVVMQWTGHSDYKAMKPYIAIAESAKRDAMKLFNQ